MDNEGYDRSQRNMVPTFEDQITIRDKRSHSVISLEDQLTFSWDELTVRTEPKKGRNCCGMKTKDVPSKVIVNNAKGVVKPGEILAIMGASGAGKSTLLNALTFKNLSGLEVSGQRYLNGEETTYEILTSVSAYIQQNDLFIGTLTPREHLTFQARVRMPKKMPMSQRMQRVEEVLDEQGLRKCQNTLIGITGRYKGISGGESKRLAFASEILTNPPILFCDEPTSGLDSYMAENVVRGLRDLASKGKTIICTIHQPSSEVFTLFDKLLLMAEGRLAYLGPAKQALNFFSSVGYPCPELFNPADHYVHTLAITPGNVEQSKERVKAICDTFENSNEGKQMKESVDFERSHSVITTLSKDDLKGKGIYRASAGTEFLALLNRAWKSVIKEPAVIRVQFAQTLFIPVILGIVYLQQEYDQAGVFNMNGALFITTTNVTFSNVFGVINVFCLELPIFLREHSNGAYRAYTYYISKQLAEAPIYVVFPTIFATILYWMVGFNDDPVRYLIYVLIVVILTHVVIGFGYLCSTISGDLQVAIGIAPVVLIPFLLFGGFFLRSDSTPPWLSWIQYISWFHYGFEALMINQWTGIDDIRCSESVPGFSNVTSPSVCPYVTGEDVIEKNGLNPDNLVFDITMLVVMAVVFRIGGYLALLQKTMTKK